MLPVTVTVFVVAVPPRLRFANIPFELVIECVVLAPAMFNHPAPVCVLLLMMLPLISSVFVTESIPLKMLRLLIDELPFKLLFPPTY
jgi:hypothetical protein